MKRVRWLKWSVMLVGCWLQITTVEADTAAAWEAYRERFISEHGRVIDTGNNNISHSEGQGWGMMLAVHHNDRESFDQLWRWTRYHLARKDIPLFSWRYDPMASPPVSDLNNATDGDLFIAWALYLASQQWPDGYNYGSASRSIRTAIIANLTAHTGDMLVLLPGLQGFKHHDTLTLNLSYWFMPALYDFAILEPEQPWQALIDSGAMLLERARFGAAGLPTDWITIAPDSEVAPADGWPPRFGFDAVRIPLYFTWADKAGAEGLANILEFWNDEAFQPPAAWMDVETGERAEYAISRGVSGIRALANGEPLPSPTPQQADDYFSSTLLLLAHMGRDGRFTSAQEPARTD